MYIGVLDSMEDVDKHSDWIIDIGPDRGKEGGEIILDETPTVRF
ncbi:excinuclease UvrABC ATPase subunit [Scopulibacillus daqui]|uniref:Excinuclease UvrABC ATPase subunit n=1 Tax=Scopulibacillus daqui TaxID=1469162 RepID=A0ABS2PZY3_9BACL|nr:hypothetical protein [Scopulibacillus daqui]MBM7645613.1 excinuclease UvrABC ATPase subunit [Scopulibacillus daqui]